MDSFFALGAAVGVYDPKFSNVEAARHFGVDIVAFGLRKGGPEISQTVKVPAGGLLHLAKIFESMKRPGSMSFLMPLDKKLYLSVWRGKKLDLEITFGEYNDSGKVSHQSKLYFDDVSLDKHYPDSVVLPDATLKYERVDLHFRVKPVFTV